MNNNCPFCNFKDDRILKNAKDFLVIFSNPRLVRGHLLIIPKRHVGKISELEKNEKEELVNLMGEYEDKILEKLASSCDIRINYKPFLENSKTHVNHLHVHLIPRDVSDEIEKQVDLHRKPLYKDLPEKEKEKLFKLLR